MNMGLARLVVAALIAGSAFVHSTGLGWLKIVIPQTCYSGSGRLGCATSTTVLVHYEDRDGNGYLSFGAPDPRNNDRLLGATVVSE